MVKAPINLNASRNNETFKKRRLTNSRGARPWIRRMKFILPTFAISSLLLVVAWPLITFQNANFLGIDFSDVMGGGLNNMKVIDARFFSTDKDKQPYNVTADKVMQLDDQTYELTMPKADLLMAEGNWALVSANFAEYKQENQDIDFKGKVEWFHDLGYELYTETMAIDLKNGIANGKEQVKGQGASGTFIGEGFIIEKRGLVLKLTGKSEVNIAAQ